MDEQIRALEQRWQSSGEEADRFAWLCAKLRSEGPPREERELEELAARILEVYEEDDDVSVKCGFGYVLEEPDPIRRLGELSGHRGWYPAEDLAKTLAIVMETNRPGMLYPHQDYDTSALQSEVVRLFEGAQVFANYRDHTSATGWGRSSTRFEGRKDDWELGKSLAVGATLGPLVGFVAVNLRDSI